MKNRRKPPAFAEFLMSLLLPKTPREEVIDYLSDEFEQKRRYYGRYSAVLWYWWQVSCALYPGMGLLVREAFFLLQSALNKTVFILKTDPNQEPPSPPLLGKFLMKVFVPRDGRAEAIGDAEGEFAINWKEFGKWGKWAAWFLYWEQVAIECSKTIWRIIRWLFLNAVLRHMSDIFHRYVG